MTIDIDGLQAFVRIAELGSFRQAADAMCLSAPALSHRISKLERNLGVRLLDRTTRTVRLTSVGREFLPQGRRLLDELERSISNLRDAAKHGAGQVTFACIPTAATYMLPPVMREYTAKFPRNHIRILDFRAQETIQAVRRGEAEFGITLGIANDRAIEFENLFEDPFVVVGRREHPIARQRRVAWKDLKKYQLISVGRLSGNYPSLDFALNSIAQSHGLYEVQQSFTTGLDLAEAGMGIIVLPRLAFLRSRHPMLIHRPLVNPAVTRSICLAWRRGTTPSPAAQKFLDLLKSRWLKKPSAVE